MTGPTVVYKVTFGRRRESRLTRAAAPRAEPVPATAGTDDAPTPAPAATPIARLLATAHQVERLIEAGVLKDYADAARQLGMAKSHMTHVTNLLRLAPDIQEAILLGRLDVSERRLRPIAAMLNWKDQAVGRQGDSSS